MRKDYKPLNQNPIKNIYDNSVGININDMPAGDVSRLNTSFFRLDRSFFNVGQNIKNNATALLNYVTKNKATLILSAATILLATKILHDYAHQENYEAEILAYQNATEQVFCLMKKQILSLIQTANDTDSLQEQFKELLTNMDEKMQYKMNETLNLKCIN